MTKIRAEIDVIDSNYCENEDTTCPMCLVGDWGQYYCALFDNALEMDEENHHYCKRCEKCKQAEVERMNKEQVKKITKEEVKKALALCLNGCCYGCPYDDLIRCREKLSEDVLQLIDEQETVIERLKAYNDKLSQDIYYGNGEHLCNSLNQAKKQAVKEFAEKLKQKYAQSCSEYYPDLIALTSEQLDELLKEYE